MCPLNNRMSVLRIAVWMVPLFAAGQVLPALAQGYVTWMDVTPVPSGPPVRMTHSMAYDDNYGMTVIFGGYNSSTKHGDTWLWNGDSWTLAHPGKSPIEAGGKPAEGGKTIADL